jgi:hypothetical protein
VIPLPKPDPAVIKAIFEADTKMYEEAKAKYGEPRAAALSELANLAALAPFFPAISASIDNLIPHSITAFGIPMEEGMLWIRKFREGRTVPLSPVPLSAQN